MSVRKEVVAEANKVDINKVRCDKCYFAKEPDPFLGVVCTFSKNGHIEMRNNDFCGFWHDKEVEI